VISPQVETKLLYETLGSPIMEKSLATSGLRIGEWKFLTNWVDADDNAVQSYFNTGVPVTFDITRMPDGSLVKTRERASFLWEKSFEPFSQWEPTADWLDGVMFRTTLPQDFVVGLAFVNPNNNVGTIRLKNRAVFHFQPVRYRKIGTYDPSYDDPLEIEQSLANVGATMDIRAFEIETNYWAFESQSDDIASEVEAELVRIGFNINKLWMPPPGKRHGKLREAFD